MNTSLEVPAPKPLSTISNTGHNIPANEPPNFAPAPLQVVHATHPENFNPATTDISDVKSLQKLKRKQLCKLCFHHRVSAGGTNEAIISRLIQQCKIPPFFNPSTT